MVLSRAVPFLFNCTIGRSVENVFDDDTKVNSKGLVLWNLFVYLSGIVRCRRKVPGLPGFRGVLWSPKVDDV